MIEYRRLKIEYLRFAFGLRPVGVDRAYASESDFHELSISACPD